MGKSEEPTPNLRLKHERELRGWSQAVLAGKVGTASFNVSQWESGRKKPSPHYREKLCELFGKNALELGFIEENERSRDEQYSDRLSQDIADSSSEQYLNQPSHQNARNYRVKNLSILDRLQIIFARPTEVRSTPLSAKDKLEDAYRKLLTISEARLNFAGTVEPLRRYNSLTAYERLPQVKAELDTAEQLFDEDDARRTLGLLDNNKVWGHYVMATEAFQQYSKRTQELVQYALEPLPPLTYRIMRFEVLLADDDSLEEDPETRKVYRELQNEIVAMRRAMNRRLRF